MKSGPAEMWPVGTGPVGGSPYANPSLPISRDVPPGRPALAVCICMSSGLWLEVCSLCFYSKSEQI